MIFPFGQRLDWKHLFGRTWKVLYTDGSGDPQELALGAANTALVSTGAAAAPTMQVVPVRQGTGRATGKTAAEANVATYTVGGSDASFLVMANVLVTTSTTHNFTVVVDYTDEGNTARTLTLTFSQVGGTLLTAITNVTGAGPYEGLPLLLRAKASTSIAISSASGGAYTTVTYSIEAHIIQVA